MSQQRTEEELISLLSTLRPPPPPELFEQIQTNYDVAIQIWMGRSKEEWREFCGFNGVDIYNYLHPQQALQTATGVSPASSGGSVSTDPILLEILRRTLMEIPGTLTARNRLFKMNLRFGYDCADGSNSTYCMLLGISLPNSVVIAAHLFRRSLEYLARSLMDFDDIDNARNGLLLFAPIEKAYDNFDISFIWSNESSSFKIKVFNSAMLQRLLIEDLTFEQLNALGVNLALTQQNRNAGQAVRPTYAPGTQFDIYTTYGEIEAQGAELLFRNNLRPFRRCLNFQAKLARKRAISRGWVMPSYDFPDFASENYAGPTLLTRYFLSMETRAGADDGRDVE